MSDANRCAWSLGFQAYVDYHDQEWGVPVHDDKSLFEFLTLEGAQAGLSWATILKRRGGYKEAFAHWDVQKVANYDQKKIDQILLDPGVIRNKLKIHGTVTNAQKFIEVQSEFGSFDTYIWNFVGGQPIVNKWESLSETPATTIESDALSKALKKRGFKFVGSTIMYAYMQACGLVNDHVVGCFRYHEVGLK